MSELEVCVTVVEPNIKEKGISVVAYGKTHELENTIVSKVSKTEMSRVGKNFYRNGEKINPTIDKRIIENQLKELDEREI